MLKTKLFRSGVALMFLGCPLLCRAQKPKAKPTLDAYIARSVRDLESLHSATIAQWARRHPGEMIETPDDRNNNYDPSNERQQQDRKLEGRWCLRSTTEIDLARGVHVRRIALFYQPLVELSYGKPLPPLPTQTDKSLRENGCRLVKILHEFEGVSDPQKSVEAIASQLPGKRQDEPGRMLESSGREYWNPVYSFNKFGGPFYHHFLFTRNPKTRAVDESPTVLLEAQWGTEDYGSPSAKTINPESGQPWLATRAAMHAKLPEGLTLDMLSFLAPQVGDIYEQPPFNCHRQLVPVLRKWLDLASHSAPEQHAAAILLADRVLDRLWECEEFSNSISYLSPEEDASNHDALEKDLQELGIKTQQPRVGNEYYTGNLLEEVLKLAPEGVVNQLGRMAVLDDRCQWDHNSESAECTNIINEGEAFLSRFPEDEWTPSVHLILAEAYALTSANPVESYSPPPKIPKTEAEAKAAAHYRAWYAKSLNERNRALIWQEIWALEAGMGPWLMMPYEVQQ